MVCEAVDVLQRVTAGNGLPEMGRMSELVQVVADASQLAS
ncbi:hypothetical protein GCM10007872_25810 [Gluconobacter sphaericus NBRC 12467]|uniref:Uncharacterized protein n=1 Tax=Gluconobacter sphaericus NBRC 12467 TaxID=1307951 RepID=A0AA37WCF4_9PROT|nr:hypothetical protein GSP01_27110 [Gluconobacter sphaericus NBRC 12467]GLQ85671.1 hypothetical protein GCM10007872_25810 [Gluconobacter sphaericus NBRC 12467]